MGTLPVFRERAVLVGNGVMLGNESGERLSASALRDVRSDAALFHVARTSPHSSPSCK